VPHGRPGAGDDRHVPVDQAGSAGRRAADHVSVGVYVGAAWSPLVRPYVLAMTRCGETSR